MAAQTAVGVEGTEDHGSVGEGRAGRLRGLGAEMRAIRTRQGLSSVALAQRVGVSPSLISQVERGVTSPSLEVLWGIARVLDVPIGTFFQDSPAMPLQSEPKNTPSAVVVRANQRKRLGMPNSLTYELLSPDLKHRIEFIWSHFEPGDESPKEPYTHSGEEQMVVVRGELTFYVDDEVFLLGEGDAITIDSGRPHRAANHSDRPTLVIAAITPPSF